MVYFPSYYYHLVVNVLWFKKFNPSLYERTGWHYREANIDHIKRSIDEFNCEDVLNYQVLILNETFKNKVKNFVPKENILCND